MDEQTFRVLEFEKILRMAATFAATAPGKIIVSSIRPYKSIEDIRRQIDTVSECRTLLSEGQFPGIEHFEELSVLFRKLRPADAVLDPLELRSFLPLFHSAVHLKALSNDPSYVRLGDIVSDLITHADIGKSIEDAIEGDGKIRDEASPELSSIRKSIKSTERKLRSMLEAILAKKDLAPHVQDFFIAERNNRWVIPVKSDSKGSIPGIVHDISNTGETVYMEPYSIQHMGNELETYRAEEKLEIFRILQRLSLWLREHLHEIEEDYRIVARVDAVQAIAVLAGNMDMTPPEISEDRYLKINRGRHPILWSALAREDREADIIPLYVELGRGHTGMVITGSNAGGKTVALKTIGVTTLMALSGMHTPSAAGTTIPFFDRVYADIGDEQSIEANLSTFSAHITRISDVIRQSSEQALVIIDELGTGTDPEQGGALSCAILKKLQRQGALTLVTTHLGMLKAFAHSEPGMINSAMEMKEINKNGFTSYRPTYKLIIGEPGASHAFEIAESLGLNEDIISEARGFITGEGARIESLISTLEQKAAEFDKKMRDVDELKKHIENEKSQLNDERAKAEMIKKTIKSDALAEAEEFVRRTRAEAQGIIEAIKRSNLTSGRKAAKSLDRKMDELKAEKELYSPKETEPLKHIEKGQQVFIRTLNTHGIVHSLSERSGKCTVLVHGKEVVVPVGELSAPEIEKTEQDRVSESKRDRREPPHASLSEDMDVPGELNIVGTRVDPALSLVERYLNDASLAGLQRIKIIHGIGTGRLSHAVRDYLKDHPLVERFRSGSEDEGGGAVTLVDL